MPPLLSPSPLLSSISGRCVYKHISDSDACSSGRSSATIPIGATTPGVTGHEPNFVKNYFFYCVHFSGIFSCFSHPQIYMCILCVISSHTRNMRAFSPPPSPPSPLFVIRRCVYNHMSDTHDCSSGHYSATIPLGATAQDTEQDTTSASRDAVAIRSVHFTQSCPKPWLCVRVSVMVAKHSLTLFHGRHMEPGAV